LSEMGQKWRDWGRVDPAWASFPLFWVGMAGDRREWVGSQTCPGWLAVARKAEFPEKKLI